MLKLYKNTSSGVEYWETWDDGNGNHTVHWGSLGTRGKTKTLSAGLFRDPTKKIQTEVEGLLESGYSQLEIEDHVTLLVEYAVDGFGTSEDLDKRHELEQRLNETLGWTGLGHVDGGSTGSGTMEACCYVVDFEIAKSVIERELKGTEFDDYTRIYDEDAA